MRKSCFAVSFCFTLAFPTGLLSQEIVIAALGDSLTQGFGLPVNDGFVPQLQSWLDDAGADVRLINAGVSGDTTAGGLARVGWTLTSDVDGMIVALGGNDLLRGLPPEEARTNLTGILQAAAQADVEILLIGMEAPSNFGPAYKAAFDAIYPDLAAAYDTLFLDSFFAGLMNDGERPDLSELRAFFQPDGIHPNAAGVSKIVDRIGPEVLKLVQQINTD
ncbi:MAG: arylesterase [Pseudomonadota bacterium]